jgi:hypothetical protein
VDLSARGGPRTCQVSLTGRVNGWVFDNSGTNVGKTLR